MESPETCQVTHAPPEYQSFRDVFSKEAATHLPPHRPWDCCIDLLPGAKLPRGHIYPLSIPERTAMEEYIKEALHQGFIRPSTSPAASSFFFVAKKDGGLRPCIDYRVLNDQTVKFAYPLPLVPAALEELRGACIFSKLDLRSAYNLIRIRRGDEWKTAFVTPTGHYDYRVIQLTFHLPEFHARNLQRLVQPVRPHLHRRHTHILTHHRGAPSPRHPSPSAPSSTPPLPENREV